MEENKASDRRTKSRFEMHRELRYKVTGEGMPSATGTGQTLNMSSTGVAFGTEHRIEVGAFVELSINWPVLLNASCPMRLIVFGRVLRSQGSHAVCSIDKYEFRTAPRTFQVTPTVRHDAMLQRWAEGIRKGMLKESVAGA
jgi:hypothetical protein